MHEVVVVFDGADTVFDQGVHVDGESDADSVGGVDVAAVSSSGRREGTRAGV